MKKSKKIKILLLENDVSQAEVARKLNIPRSNVNRVIMGGRPTRYIRQAIADAVGKPYAAVWGKDSSSNA